MLADLEDTDNEGGNGGQLEKPHLYLRSLEFELDPCRGNGKVCLVYKNTKPGSTCTSPSTVNTEQLSEADSFVNRLDPNKIFLRLHSSTLKSCGSPLLIPVSFW
ncbi:Hypothetical predicted protein [Podarcis lilfordi]|uniref:Uncharacterized protein n=1 Tax=Podarcis lilfordi TaxID=74358 RepID=A0AA35PJ71_9SAUR|nr:Hypothetical predicted protein [Podarcis lilfordi]